jgi:imidazole glycerol phosphate synthase glutamine amidotransferase subunit
MNPSDPQPAGSGMLSTRTASVERRTNETQIKVSLDLDGQGKADIHTGIGFLDHMLHHVALHGLFDLAVSATGDLDVDAHHTVEDVALALGQAFDQALGDRRGITRIASAYVPMDESLALLVVDFSGRPYTVVNAEWHAPMLGALPTSLIPHFLESFAAQARINLHAQVLYGRDDHHQAEAIHAGQARFPPRKEPFNLMTTIWLVDAGTGNLHSVYNALRHLDAEITVTSSPADLAKGGPVILPGVGAFAHFMEGLRHTGLADALLSRVQSGDPLFGICVGMQALFEASEELGETTGLGLLPGRVVRFPASEQLKVPHTGWNQLLPQGDSPLTRGLTPGEYAYFNHSYFCQASAVDATAKTEYGLSFASMVQRAGIYGVQFHPEKSQRVGLRILQNYLDLIHG